MGNLAGALAVLPAQGQAGGEKAARYLLKFYAACERILILINREVSGQPDRRRDWQTRLWQEAETGVAGIRPAILSAANCRMLQKLLAFRNLERNIYGYAPAPYVIEKLSALVVAQQPRLAEDFQRFLSFLQQRLRPAEIRQEKKSSLPSTCLRFVLPDA